MMKVGFFMFLLAGSVILLGCDMPDLEQIQQRQHLPDANFVADPKRGDALFHARCVRCHGEKGSGTDQGPPLVHQVYRPGHHANLTFHWAVKDGVKQHHWHFGDMPSIADVSPQQVGHIIAYIRREQRKADIR